MRIQPVRRIRYFFRDGPRSLLRRRVALEPVDPDRVVITVGVAIAIALLGLVIYAATPNRWLAAVAIILVASLVWTGTQRLIARWPRDERDHLPDAEMFIPLPLALSPIVFFVAVVVTLSFGWHNPLWGAGEAALVVSWVFVSRWYGGRVSADKARIRAAALRLRNSTRAPSDGNP
jgi:hypothetical protein